MKSRLTNVIVAAAALLTLQACGSDSNSSSTGDDPADPVMVLLNNTDKTVLGQPFEYPTAGSPQISTSLVTLQPGDETGWHHHNTPLVGYIMEGTLVVDYGDDGNRTYETGDALVEAIDTSHNGAAKGDSPVKILVVNIGAEGIDNTAAD